MNAEKGSSAASIMCLTVSAAMDAIWPYVRPVVGSTSPAFDACNFLRPTPCIEKDRVAKLTVS